MSLPFPNLARHAAGKARQSTRGIITKFNRSEILLEPLAVVALFFGMHWGLHYAKTLDQANMLPFAGSEEVARRVEREISRSRTGCGCSGRCQGDCRHQDKNWPA